MRCKIPQTIGRCNKCENNFELFEAFCGQNLVPLMSHLAEKRDFTKEEIAFLEQLVKQKKGAK
jgi:predicted transcriptional regulator